MGAGKPEEGHGKLGATVAEGQDLATGGWSLAGEERCEVLKRTEPWVQMPSSRF